MELSMMALALGFLIDLLIGDPHWMYHPVRLIGALIAKTEKKLSEWFPKTDVGQLSAGILLVIVVVLVSTFVPWLLLFLSGKISIYFEFFLMTVMSYQLLATKSLKTESMKVYNELEQGDIKGARYAVSMIVGRDTENLTEEEVTKAAVETIAENTSDGIIAPLLFMAIGGPVAGFFYKSINTMDSMVGYKNERYLYLGRAAAKLDDIVNYIPARLSAYFMIVATEFTSFDGKEAYRIYKRDRYNHTSPNSAHTEAVMAGALGVQLAGDAYYFGKLHKKPKIGDSRRAIEPADIKNANQLLYLTASIALVCFLSIKFILFRNFIL
ncbi:adenosylcobinamide-phosphate synthase CbiB [Velocimicrobium porci]|uniref:Cobalamin biosynthesis protein CobD n=1 Tax=Velocimicrobium porci TaxID=2606634 RepID=A0A6L5XV56_9FIRM|nr:adenosylcobinamide-phosphate synthase CbiB [Velocimicrobium porci]MSS62504.1 cobalamin biosynthesis protein CobD [Velocimicrobium porci]